MFDPIEEVYAAFKRERNLTEPKCLDAALAAVEERLPPGPERQRALTDLRAEFAAPLCGEWQYRLPGPDDPSPF